MKSKAAVTCDVSASWTQPTSVWDIEPTSGQSLEDIQRSEHEQMQRVSTVTCSRKMLPKSQMKIESLEK